MPWRPSRKHIARLNQRPPVALVSRQEAMREPGEPADDPEPEESLSILPKPPPKGRPALYGMTCHDGRSHNKYTSTLQRTEKVWREAVGEAWNTPVHKRSKP